MKIRLRKQKRLPHQQPASKKQKQSFQATVLSTEQRRLPRTSLLMFTWSFLLITLTPLPALAKVFCFFPPPGWQHAGANSSPHHSTPIKGRLTGVKEMVWSLFLSPPSPAQLSPSAYSRPAAERRKAIESASERACTCAELTEVYRLSLFIPSKCNHNILIKLTFTG